MKPAKKQFNALHNILQTSILKTCLLFDHNGHIKINSENLRPNNSLQRTLMRALMIFTDRLEVLRCVDRLEVGE